MICELRFVKKFSRVLFFVIGGVFVLRILEWSVSVDDNSTVIYRIIKFIHLCNKILVNMIYLLEDYKRIKSSFEVITSYL